MPGEDYKPRFTFEISDELKTRADNILDSYGQRKAIFTPILEDVLDLLEEHGGIVLGVIISKKLKPRDIIPIMHKADSVGKSQKEDQNG